MNERDTERPQRSEDERAGQLAGSASAQPENDHHGGAVRFAPNFSVYVLPPDSVCLYSEDRKFFLHGALYCALASRIGAGGRRDAIVRALAGEFPAAEIEQAL